MYSPVKIREDLILSKLGRTIEYYNNHNEAQIIVECLSCQNILTRRFSNAGNKHRCLTSNCHNKRCFICGLWKDKSQFSKNLRNKIGLQAYCKTCISNQRCPISEIKDSQLDEENIIRFISCKLSELKSKCHKKNIPFEISFDYLLDVWNKQNDMCYYTNIKMFHDEYKWHSPSVDRKIPGLGYIKGNIVWCCNAVNSFKGLLTHDEFLKKIKQLDWTK